MEANYVSIVNELLNGSGNYEKWSFTIKTYLRGRGLWDVVDPEQIYNEEPVSEQRDATAFHAILVSCGPNPYSLINTANSARMVWNILQDAYGRGETRNNEEVPTEQDTNKNGTEQNQTNAPPVVGIEGSDSNPVVAYKSDIRPYLSLFEAVYRGDWDTTKEFLDQHIEAIRVMMSGKNVLHVAVTRENLHMVKKLVERMTDVDLEIASEGDNYTALAAAIQIGNLPIAKYLVRRHKKLVTIISSFDGLPVHHAITNHRRKLVRYLYPVTPIKELISIDHGKHCAAILSQSIYAKHYDIALDLVARFPELAITEDLQGKSPLWALASAKLFGDNEPSLIFWRRWIYKCIYIPSWSKNHISVEVQKLDDNESDKEDKNLEKALDSFFIAGRRCSGLLRWLLSTPLQLLDIKSIYQLKLVQLQTQEILRHMSEVVKASSDQAQLQNVGLSNIMIQAAQNGNVDFIISMAKANLEYAWDPYTSKRVVEVAVEFRLPKTFSLIYGIAERVSLATYEDTVTGSNLLHKAAIVASPSLLNRVPGAALQMQKELQWFKEVQTIVAPEATMAVTKEYPDPENIYFLYSDTKKEITASEIFTKTHKDLVVEGEKWMKDTASSCTIVGALIITLTFAAAFTFPGGYEQTKGYPMLIENFLFKVFMISNALALSSSTTSVLMFLGILTSRYAEEDFLKSLPKKLIIGLSTLFVSIAAMLTAFCVGLTLMFHQELWIVVPLALLASIPVALFVVIQFPLLVDIFMSTYGPCIFKRNTKQWI